MYDVWPDDTWQWQLSHEDGLVCRLTASMALGIPTDIRDMSLVAELVRFSSLPIHGDKGHCFLRATWRSHSASSAALAFAAGTARGSPYEGRAKRSLKDPGDGAIGSCRRPASRSMPLTRSFLAWHQERH